MVLNVCIQRLTPLLFTGEAENLDLGPMVRKGEVAWLHKRDMPGTGQTDPADVARPMQQQFRSSPQANPKKRKVCDPAL